MSELRDPELDAFVELLRRATPSDATLAIARERVVADAATPAPSATRTILARLSLLTSVVLATVLGAAGVIGIGGEPPAGFSEHAPRGPIAARPTASEPVVPR